MQHLYCKETYSLMCLQKVHSAVYVQDVQWVVCSSNKLESPNHPSLIKWLNKILYIQIKNNSWRFCIGTISSSLLPCSEILNKLRNKTRVADAGLKNSDKRQSWRGTICCFILSERHSLLTIETQNWADIHPVLPISGGAEGTLPLGNSILRRKCRVELSMSMLFF